MSPHEIPGLYYSGSLLGLLIFIADLVAVVQVLNSNRPMSSKILWSLLIFLCPLIGLLIYLLLGERERRRLRYLSIP
ncbi:hypothetical protein F5H01DRAFT_333931 [Linnemannia elongata]|uniref:Cardiolipin synthase N-terminal domain-containing protein n=1 Tax=Linnemannia elongata AG-77 TaxID=1314771 RepID=A0A197JPY1_9FUNG|nr:hypothetical protein F5H01DRAFT_333931 [Linnemannia elongata]OAQ27018.1 hypothetical protein K457DRAFT_21656 [Linnemannia elongata AG-77]